MKTYSFSGLNSFYTCPYAYYLHYIEKREEIDNAFNLYGSFVHEILEKYFKGELELFELADYYEEHFDEKVPLDFPPNAFVDLGQTYYDNGLAYLESFEGLDGYEVLGVELEFTIPIFDGYALHGFIDLLLKDPRGDIVIMDHKSKKKFTSKEEKEKYARQLFLYALYVHEHYGRWPKRIVFNTFRSQKYVKIQFTEEALQEALNWAKETIEAIESTTEWNACPSEFFCDHICGYRESCERKRGSDN